MSSKLVKKQLSSVLAGAVEKSRNPASQPAPVKSKRRQRKSKTGGKARAASKPSAEAVRAANLEYFKQTARASAATQDLLAQALRICGGGGAAAEQPQDDDDFGDDDLLF